MYLTPIAVASLFLTAPVPLEMPRAEAFQVREEGRCRLEDRYDRMELWTSQAVVGRWVDKDERVFLLADLDFEPPVGDVSETLTREDYAAQRVPMPRLRANREIPRGFRRAIGLLADTPLTDDRPRRSRQVPHGYDDVTYWQHPTNLSTVVCAFRPEKSERWHLAVWTLAEGDDLAERTTRFEDEFLRREYRTLADVQTSNLKRQTSNLKRQTSNLKLQTSNGAERELLRADARHSVAAYPDWHVTDAEEFTVLDDTLSRDLVEKVTNEFAVVRAAAAAALPTSIDGSNVLCVARIFASRAEYLVALEATGNTNMAWTAAYWDPAQRELVAYLPERGVAEFLKTIRHETFHQYLSYAASMISVSPWLNEGYAQYFEDVDAENGAWSEGLDMSDEGLKRIAAVLPQVLNMDYDSFYAESDTVRLINYRLAWSLAIFLEKGADKVRFRPFANLKRDYFKALIETHDMRKATAAAFRDQDTLKLFVSEWTKFWKEQ